MSDDMLQTAQNWIAEGRTVALATVLSVDGSSVRREGSQLVIDRKGRFEGSVSGGCVEAAVITEAFDVLDTGTPREITFGVADEEAWEVGLSCGGRIAIYIEPANPHSTIIDSVIALRDQGMPCCLLTDMATGEKTIVRPDDEDHGSTVRDVASRALATDRSMRVTVDGRSTFVHAIHPPLKLIIIGAVHIAQPLTMMAQLMGYDVTIIDPRKAFANTDRFPGIAIDNTWPDEGMNRMTIHGRTAIVTLAHDPKLDDEALIAALLSPAFYIGALGSKKTHTDRLSRLRERGLTDTELHRIHGPVGLSIGAQSPSEIAVAILAEMTQEMYEANARNRE